VVLGVASHPSGGRPRKSIIFEESREELPDIYDNAGDHRRTIVEIQKQLAGSQHFLRQEWKFGQLLGDTMWNDQSTVKGKKDTRAAQLRPSDTLPS
jgi:hypothetical protein